MPAHSRWLMFMAVISLTLTGVIRPDSARAGVYTLYAQDVPSQGAPDWQDHNRAEGSPSSDCNSSGACAWNSLENSTAYLEATDFTNFTLAPGERVVSVVVSAKVRYDQNSSNNRVRIRVRSIANPDLPETGRTYSWNQGSSLDCRWVTFDGAAGWDITSFLEEWDQWAVNHVRVAIRRYPATDLVPPCLCRVDCFRIIVTTAPCTAVCLFDPPAPLDFGAVDLGDFSEEDFSIVNDSPDCGILTGNVSLNCTGGPFTIVDGLGPFTLEPGDEHIVTVAFAPRNAGTFTCSINTGTPCGAYQVRGTGVCPQECDVFPESSLDFGDVEIGECSGEEEVEIYNDSDCASLSVNVTESCSAFSIVSGQGPYTIPPQGSRLVTVRFQPTTLGPSSCTLATGASLCGTYLLRGTGVPAEYCWADEDTLSFGDVPVGGSEQDEFTIYNNGDCAVVGGNITETSPDFSIIGGGVFSLQPGQSRTVQVIFEPQSPGPKECAIDMGTNLCPPVHCTGTGQGPTACCLEEGECRLVMEDECWALGGDPLAASSCDPWPCPLLCELSDDWLEFDDLEVGTADTLGFTLYHPGGGTLIGTVSEDCPCFDLVAGGGPYSLGPGDSLGVRVRFAPQEPSGEYECAIRLGTSECDTVWCFGWGEQVSGVPGRQNAAERDRLQFQNPFHRGGTVLLATTHSGPSSVEVYDVAGRRVRRLYSGDLGPGMLRLDWRGDRDDGSNLPGGVYTILAVHGDRRWTGRLVLVP